MSSLLSAGLDRGDAVLGPPSGSVPRQTPTDDFNAMLRRIRLEFLELPGLRLTERQAERLWALDPSTCAALLATLIDAKILTRRSDGSVTRSDYKPPLARAEAT